MRRRDELAAHNERVKLQATTSNAVGLAVLALGVVRPLIVPDVPIEWSIVIFGAVALAGHALAYYILKQLELDE